MVCCVPIAERHGEDWLDVSPQPCNEHRDGACPFGGGSASRSGIWIKTKNPDSVSGAGNTGHRKHQVFPGMGPAGTDVVLSSRLRVSREPRLPAVSYCGCCW